jgi:hypothetical protein
MARVIRNAGQPSDDRGDARKSPKIRAVTVSPGALAQGFFNTPQLGGIQFRLTAGSASASQRFYPVALPLFIPPTHTLAADLELSGNGGQDQLARREQAGGMFSPLFQSLKISSWTILSRHAQNIHQKPVNVTLLCEPQ